MSAADRFLREVEPPTDAPSVDDPGDIGNGVRFWEQWRGKAVHVERYRGWMVWDGRVWVRDLEGVRVDVMARETVREMLAEAVRIEQEATDRRMALTDDSSEEERKRVSQLQTSAEALRRHAIASARLTRRQAMIASARGYDGMEVDAAQLDAELHVLNTATGIVDLRTGELRPHDANRWCTKTTGYGYDPTATCPHWQAFIQRFTGGVDELAEWLQRLIGLAASGNVGERLLPILKGSGGNGKTTLATTLQRVLGGYAITGDADVILSTRRDGGPAEEIADLQGARLVVLPELPPGTLNAGRVKRLTGGDRITTHRKYEHSFRFDPCHTFLLDANVAPRVGEHTTAVWDRVRLIPCEHRFADSGVSKEQIHAIFASEGPGILHWIVAGAIAYHADGLGTEPDAVRVATSAYRTDQDVTAQWIAERCNTSDRGTWTATKVLHDDYSAWCEANGHKPRSAVGLGIDLTNHGLTARQGAKGRRGWGGIQLAGGDS